MSGHLSVSECRHSKQCIVAGLQVTIGSLKADQVTENAMEAVQQALTARYVVGLLQSHRTDLPAAMTLLAPCPLSGVACMLP